MSETRTIFVVDDDAFIRRPLEFVLRRDGFRVHTAVDGNDCVRLLEEALPDLIIMDVMMPGRDGFAVCRLLRQDARFCDIPIILLSARERPEDRETGMSMGATDFMTKPCAPSALIHRVRELLSMS